MVLLPIPESLNSACALIVRPGGVGLWNLFLRLLWDFCQLSDYCLELNTVGTEQSSMVKALLISQRRTQNFTHTYLKTDQH
jgi:hypothetical protein